MAKRPPKTRKNEEMDDDTLLSPVAAAEFLRVQTLLEDRGTFSEDDVSTIEVHAMAWANFREASQLIRKHGIVAYTDRGIAFQHPAVGVMKTSQLILIKCSKLLGLSPADRAGIKVKKKGADDSKARFFSTVG
jgi:P27 family predicted phage terminase small subunit